MIDPSKQFNIDQSIFPNVNALTDGVDVTFSPSVLRVGGAGDVDIVNLGGKVVPIKGCVAGEFIRGLAIGFHGTTSTATGLTRYD